MDISTQNSDIPYTPFEFDIEQAQDDAWQGAFENDAQGDFFDQFLDFDGSDPLGLEATSKPSGLPPLPASALLPDAIHPDAVLPSVEEPDSSPSHLTNPSSRELGTYPEPDFLAFNNNDGGGLYPESSSIDSGLAHDSGSDSELLKLEGITLYSPQKPAAVPTSVPGSPSPSGKKSKWKQSLYGTIRRATALKTRQQNSGQASPPQAAVVKTEEPPTAFKVEDVKPEDTKMELPRSPPLSSLLENAVPPIKHVAFVNSQLEDPFLDGVLAPAPLISVASSSTSSDFVVMAGGAISPALLDNTRSMFYDPGFKPFPPKKPVVNPTRTSSLPQLQQQLQRPPKQQPPGAQHQLQGQGLPQSVSPTQLSHHPQPHDVDVDMARGITGGLLLQMPQPQRPQSQDLLSNLANRTPISTAGTQFYSSFPSGAGMHPHIPPPGSAQGHQILPQHPGGRSSQVTPLRPERRRARCPSTRDRRYSGLGTGAGLAAASLVGGGGSAGGGTPVRRISSTGRPGARTRSRGRGSEGSESPTPKLKRSISVGTLEKVQGEGNGSAAGERLMRHVSSSNLRKRKSFSRANVGALGQGQGGGMGQGQMGMDGFTGMGMGGQQQILPGQAQLQQQQQQYLLGLHYQQQAQLMGLGLQAPPSPHMPLGGGPPPPQPRRRRGKVDPFVNFTQEDSQMLMTGVAPSGSGKTKARREREAVEKRREVAVRAVEAVGGDLGVLESVGFVM